MTQEDKRLFYYYRDYYLTALGIPKWYDYVRARLEQNETYLLKIRRLLNDIGFNGEVSHFSALVVGCGTGAETSALTSFGFGEVAGVDSSYEAIQICLSRRLPHQDYLQCCAESIPLPAQSFDYIHCYTVREHVEDPEKCLCEIKRLLKPHGTAYVSLPNYNHIFEGHYKVILPLFLGKRLCKFFLRLYRRPTQFLASLSFLTPRDVSHLLNKVGFTSFKLVELSPSRKISLRYLLSKQSLSIAFTKVTGIGMMQEWLLH